MPESLKPVVCETESEAAPCIVAATEPHRPHPLLQELDPTRVSKMYRSIVDGSMKNVYKKYFVEN